MITGVSSTVLCATATRNERIVIALYCCPSYVIQSFSASSCRLAGASINTVDVAARVGLLKQIIPRVQVRQKWPRLVRRSRWTHLPHPAQHIDNAGRSVPVPIARNLSLGRIG